MGRRVVGWCLGGSGLFGVGRGSLCRGAQASGAESCGAERAGAAKGEGRVVAVVEGVFGDARRAPDRGGSRDGGIPDLVGVSARVVGRGIRGGGLRCVWRAAGG